MTTLRTAVAQDMDDIFRMGMDTWSEGLSESEHIAKCHASTKYPQGQWYVLEDAAGTLCSSAIVYKLPTKNKLTAFGFGTIATPTKLRKRGHGSKLVSGLIKLLSKDNPASIFYLYSEIIPEFYEKFGFMALPEPMQKYLPSIAMLHCAPELRPSILNVLTQETIEYF